MNNPYEANPTGFTKLASTRKMTSSSEINQRNPRHNQPPHPDGQEQPAMPQGQKLALTNKHTVEFSNNRHTPTQHHPTGQNLAWGNFSNLPDPLRPLQLGDSSGGSRGTSSPIMSRRARLRVILEGDRPGDQPPSRAIETRCPFLPAGRTSRTLHALRPGAKSVCSHAEPARQPCSTALLGSPARLPARRVRPGGTRGRACPVPPRRDAEGAGRSTRSGPFVIVATRLLSRPRRPRRRPRASSSPGAGGRTARAAGRPARGRRPRSSP